MSENNSWDEELKIEANRCLNCKNSRCMEKCPLKNNIPQIMNLIKENKITEAFEENVKTNPLGAICGLVCPQEKACESACVRGIKGESVKIGKIEHLLNKNVIQELNLNNEQSEDSDTQNDNDYKVAIIGGGPARNIMRILSFKDGDKEYYF